jgi:hypothetical protein
VFVVAFILFFFKSGIIKIIYHKSQIW